MKKRVHSGKPYREDPAGGERRLQLDQLNTQEKNAQAQYNAELSDYYSQLDRKGSAYNAAYEQDYGRYQDYLGRLDTLYGYYSNQEQQAIAKRKQAFTPSSSARASA